MGKVETIIWDLDGTLIDSVGVYTDVLREILPNHNLKLPSAETITHNYHGSLGESIGNALGVTGEILDQIVWDFLQAQEKHYEVVEHHLFGDALDFARRAGDKGIPQVLVTNREHADRPFASPRSIVANSSLNGLITDIRCGDDSVHRKPKREVVEDLLETGALIPETTLVIGDQFVDGQFALNIGARAILVNRNGGQFPHLDQFGDSYADFITIVPELATVQV